jgi:prepilin-type N-terminal cleavage/methylation domain-containing protein
MGGNACSSSSRELAHGLHGFTLIEIMLVIGLIAIVLGMGAPSFYQAAKKEPMRRVMTGMQDACRDARSRAILSGKPAYLVIRSGDQKFSVEGEVGAKDALPAGAMTSGEIPDSIAIELLEVNLMSFMQEDQARVRFFPDGTCDEFTMVVLSDQNERRMFTLESTTCISKVGDLR